MAKLFSNNATVLDYKLGIGTSAPGNTLEVKGATATIDVNATSGNSNMFLQINGANKAGFESSGNDLYITAQDATADMFFRPGNTTAVTFKRDGKVGINATAPGRQLVVHSTGESTEFYRQGSTAGWHNTRWQSDSGSTNNEVASVRIDGSFYSRSNTYGNYSDERIKENITDATSQWDDIKAFRMVNYNLKSSEGQDMPTYLGVIAQEVEAISPGVISESDPQPEDIRNSSEFGTLYEEGDVLPEGKKVGDVKTILDTVKTVKSSIIHWKALKALQEAMAKIETLETKVTALENA